MDSLEPTRAIIVIEKTLNKLDPEDASRVLSFVIEGHKKRMEKEALDRSGLTPSPVPLGIPGRKVALVPTIPVPSPSPSPSSPPPPPPTDPQ